MTGVSLEGTINAKRGTKNAYEPVFDFNNTYGIPLATLNVDSRFTKDYAFCTNGKNFAIGALTGSGYISNGGNFGYGTNTLTIGGKNTNFEFKGSINGSYVVKNGTGIRTISTEGVLANAKSLKIPDGAVKLNKAAATASMTAPTILYVQGSGELRGVGCSLGINLLKGGILRPDSNLPTAQTSNVGVINIRKNLSSLRWFQYLCEQGKGRFSRCQCIYRKQESRLGISEGRWQCYSEWYHQCHIQCEWLDSCRG